jgi:TIR domain
MKIFLSSSGQRGRAVASALRNFIPLIFQRAQVFTTSDDIETGSRWSTEIGKALSSADLAIVCITPESLNDPWLTFEAGALSMSPGMVVPLLFGLSPVDLVGPLARFQACSAKKSDIYRLFSLLNKDYEMGLSDLMLNKVFEVMWPKLEIELKAISSQAGDRTSGTADSIRSERELIEEMVEEIKQLARRMNEIEKGKVAQHGHRE